MENKPAVLGRLDDVPPMHRREAKIATHQMHIVARQQHDLAGTDHETRAVFALDPDVKLALDDVVVEDQVGCGTERRRALLGRDASRHAPWGKEVGVQEHTAGQMRHP